MTIRDRAIAAHQQRIIDQSSSEIEQEIEDHNRRVNHLTQLLTRKLTDIFGDEAVVHILSPDVGVVYATVDGVASATFHEQNSFVCMVPDVVVDNEDRAFDNWQDNPANQNAPKRRVVFGLHDVGATLLDWDECDWEIRPWV
jgi:hypothetical protein